MRSDLLHEVVLKLGLRWKIDGVLTTPTKDDLERVLDRAKEILYAEPIPSQLEIGGLLIRRTDEAITVYTNIGDLT